MVYRSERQTGLHGPNNLPTVEVTQEQLRDRFSEWVEQAKEHVGELVVVYREGRHRREYWPVHMGVIRADLDSVEEPKDINGSGIKLTDAPIVASNGGLISEFNWPVQISTIQAHESFQLFKPYFASEEGAPQLQIAFGNEAVAEWFRKNDYLRGVGVGKYVEMVRRLGFEPIITLEVEAYIAERRQVIIKNLVELALSRAGLKKRIDAVYGSVGGGVQSLYGGLAIGMAPESEGEANLRTHGARREMDQINSTAQRLMQELTSLGFDESEYYRIIARQLGLDLPAKQGEPTTE